MYVKYTVVLPSKGNKGLNQTRAFLGRLFELTNKTRIAFLHWMTTFKLPDMCVDGIFFSIDSHGTSSCAAIFQYPFCIFICINIF